jgi:phage tail-like protein
VARAMSTDPFHAFRFQVKVANKQYKGDPLGPTTAGFNSVSLPTMNGEVVEYKEGVWVMRRKFPGDVTVDDVTLSRGVTVKSSEFFTWMDMTKKGAEYRVDLNIHHMHRSDIASQADFTAVTGSRIIKLKECLPVSVKVGSDMDSQSSEISLQEITVACESFEVVNAKS